MYLGNIPLFSQALWQATGLEVQQLGLKPSPTWNFHVTSKMCLAVLQCRVLEVGIKLRGRWSNLGSFISDCWMGFSLIQVLLLLRCAAGLPEEDMAGERSWEIGSGIQGEAGPEFSEPHSTAGSPEYTTAAQLRVYLGTSWGSSLPSTWMTQQDQVQ